MTNPSPLTRTAATTRRAEVRRILLALARANGWLAFPAAEGGRWFRAVALETGESERVVEAEARAMGLWGHLHSESVWRALEKERKG